MRQPGFINVILPLHSLMVLSDTTFLYVCCSCVFVLFFSCFALCTLCFVFLVFVSFFVLRMLCFVFLVFVFFLCLLYFCPIKKFFFFHTESMKLSMHCSPLWLWPSLEALVVLLFSWVYFLHNCIVLLFLKKNYFRIICGQSKPVESPRDS